MRIAVLASGNGSNLQAILEACRDGAIPGEVVVVISDRKDAYALERAANFGVDHYFINPRSFSSREEYDREIEKYLIKYGVELVALAGYMRLLSPYLIRRYLNRILNIHPSLLPAFPGTTSVKDALEYGVKITGCTVHFVDEGIDTGPIIFQAAVAVSETDTAESLHNKIHELEHQIYPRAIGLFARGKITLQGRRSIINE
ncbi:MAG TPA: phosphoribosylglycinamide formyltransferase [Firmicutes bacterium]|nr:phosphoribosylglycinamide formyltransferase [Bacillota bacterium]